MSFSITERELDFNKWKVADLRKELKNRGLSVEGKKNELVERLQLAVGDSALLDDNVHVNEDEILDEDVLTDDEPFEDSELTKSEALDESTDKAPLVIGVKRKSVDNGDAVGKQQPKKIILNRSINFPIEVKDTSKPAPPGKENEQKTNADETESEKKCLVKVGALSPQERLERRAAKFGVTMSNEAKKEARAARFGLPSAASKVGGLVNTNIDVLKKRAERFGTTIPGSILETAEIEEKKKKREERFGKVEKVVATGPGFRGKYKLQVSSSSSSASSSTPELDEKKRLRAERFKTTAVQQTNASKNEKVV